MYIMRGRYASGQTSAALNRLRSSATDRFSNGSESTEEELRGTSSHSPSVEHSSCSTLGGGSRLSACA